MAQIYTGWTIFLVLASIYLFLMFIPAAAP